MRGLLLFGLFLAVVVLQSCDGDGEQATRSPDPISTVGATVSPAPSSEAIAFAQQYQVLHQTQREDGLWAAVVVPLSSRVEAYCVDTPRWFARESGKGNWRVFAECEKEESVPADNPLIFEFLFYPDTDLVSPWNRAAHVAQYDYPWKP